MEKLIDKTAAKSRKISSSDKQKTETPGKIQHLGYYDNVLVKSTVYKHVVIIQKSDF